MPSRVFSFGFRRRAVPFQAAAAHADSREQVRRLSLRVSAALIFGLSIALWLLMAAGIMLIW